MSARGEHLGLVGALVNRPVALGMLFLTCLIVGVIAYDRIPIQLMPDGLVEPGLQVWVANPGASAAENEEQVTRVLEEELRSLSSLEDISSGSDQDSVWIWVSFDAATDMDLAKAEVRDRIERARPRLPQTVQQVGIWSWNESDLPVMYFALLHPGDSERTDFLIDTVIRQRLEAVDGVGRLEIWGLLDDSVRILLDEDRVRAANLDLGRLIQRLSADNFAQPLGEVSDGGAQILLRSDMRFRSPEEIAAYPIGDGLCIGDLGQVVEAKTVRDSMFRLNGSYAYFGEVQKDSRANVVATCRELLRTLEELEPDPKLAGEFQFRVVFDQGRFIEQSLADLKATAGQGGILAVLVLLAFLKRFRLTLCVALSIPISAVLTIAWIYFGGGSLNLLSMAGITLAIGMLVDSSIVVVENITRIAEHRRSGDTGRTVAIRGTREVALAVVMSTLTSVVVFLPLIFMTENPTLRIILGELGKPLVVTQLVGLVVALVFTPAAVAPILGPRWAPMERLARALVPFAVLAGAAVGLAVGALRRVVHALARAGFAANRLALAIAAPLRWPLAAAILGFAAWKAREAFRAHELAEPLRQVGALGSSSGAWPVVVVDYAAPALLAALVVLLGLPRWRARAALAPPAARRFDAAGRSPLALLIDGNQAILRWTLNNRLAATGLAGLALFSVAIPRSRMEMTPFGQDESTSRVRFRVELERNFTLAEVDAEMAHYERFLEQRRERYGFQNLGARFEEGGGSISLYWESRPTPEEHQAVLKDLRENLPRLPGHRLRFVGDEQENQQSRSVVMFRLTGPDSEELAKLGREAVAVLEQVPGLTSVTSPLADSSEQVQVVLDHDVSHALGVTPMVALQNISWALRGWQLPRYQEADREIPLIIEYDEESEAGLATLRDLDIYTGQGAIPLSSFADFAFSKGSRSIYRRNGKVSFTVQARVEDPTRIKAASDAGLLALQTLELPRGYEIGEEDTVGSRQEAEFAELLAALILSIVLVFLLMCILFEHLLLPISVLFTIPFAIVGSFWTLYLVGTPMDSVGWIGIIILVGVVVNNGIVLIDRIHVLRGEGVERSQAVLQGSANRVRPILMTALTTVLGLLPVAVSEPVSQGIDYRALATCVAGGLSASTVFTLWVVPLAYTVLDDLARALAARLGWALRRPGRAAVPVRAETASEALA